MEEKRTIWIVAAVGIFLAVVLLSARMLSHGTAIKRSAAPQLAEHISGDKTGVSSPWVKSEEKPSGEDIDDNTAHVSDMTVIANNATVFAIERSKDYPDNKYSMSEQSKNEDSAPIDFNKLGEKGERDKEGNDRLAYQSAPSNDKEKAGATEQTAKVAAASKQSDSVTVSPPVVKKAVTASPAPKAAAPVKKTEEALPPTWWVQAASFNNLKYADDARTTLAGNKINADVFTHKDNSGKVFYRVRVGPYLTKSEAEYWKSRIAQIDDFASSQSFVTKG